VAPKILELQVKKSTRATQGMLEKKKKNLALLTHVGSPTRATKKGLGCIPRRSYKVRERLHFPVQKHFSKREG